MKDWLKTARKWGFQAVKVVWKRVNPVFRRPFLSKNCWQFFQKTAAKKPKLEDNTALKIHLIMFCQDWRRILSNWPPVSSNLYKAVGKLRSSLFTHDFIERNCYAKKNTWFFFLLPLLLRLCWQNLLFKKRNYSVNGSALPLIKRQWRLLLAVSKK